MFRRAERCRQVRVRNCPDFGQRCARRTRCERTEPLRDRRLRARFARQLTFPVTHHLLFVERAIFSSLSAPLSIAPHSMFRRAERCRSVRVRNCPDFGQRCARRTGCERTELLRGRWLRARFGRQLTFPGTHHLSSLSAESRTRWSTSRSISARSVSQPLPTVAVRLSGIGGQRRDNSCDLPPGRARARSPQLP